MQKTQIYFEQNTLNELKKLAKELNLSVSEFIRRIVKKEINKQKDLNSFLDTLKPLESFKETDANKYITDLRKNSRIFNENFAG